MFEASRIQSKYFMELTEFPIFNDLDREIVHDISQLLHYRQLPKKSQIVVEGDPSHSMYFILEGRVKVYLDDDSGKEIVVNIHEKGQFFGELGLIEGIPRTASVMTLEETRLGVLNENEFKKLMADHPAFSLKLMHNLVSRLREATETIRKLGLMDVYRRIVVTFLNMAEEQDGRWIIREKLTQQNIASRVGASREMVARILKDLRTGKYISTEEGCIVIHKALPHSW
ncbi:Crp/Fnr family transcriptional regulator [Pleionea mediterranea]|uniref:CRP/FNR family cyclic AMP-dependent transcriptional regulator n=1 Tax=Pleionea mediterranea TaxID=523701 RepID=A0A316FXC9_9GAMM|nr:Crp/Fnr family transcriptional regulator [Pleionea mediterranea]PWK52982.1 CRP/FNR family cyclic AMP-dependent transcriptional regulator [Pleionea mediterranea]